MATSSSSSSPRLAIKGFRQKIGKAITSSKDGKHQSPKSSRKEVEVKGLSSSSSTVAAKGVTAERQKTSPPTEQQSRLREKSIESGKSVSNCSQNQSQGFLRQPKPSSSGNCNRDSRNRFSGTGIPTRNSLIVTHNGVGGSINSSKDDQNPVHSSNGVLDSNNSVHSSMSSINGSSLPGPNTGIPKPTAAIKGTSKQISSSTSKEALKQDYSSTGAGSLSRNNKAGSPNGVVNNPISKPTLSRNGDEGRSTTMTKKESSPTPTAPKPVVDNPSIVAMVAPMQSLSNSTSVSSVDSSSHSLSHSQLSSLSHSNSNSSEASVILANRATGLPLQKQQVQAQVHTGIKNVSTNVTPNNPTTPVTLATTPVVTLINKKSEGKELILVGEDVSNQSPNGGPSSSKVSPMSVFGGSGSSSMGSLNKCVESSSGASSSIGEMGSNGELGSGGSSGNSNRTNICASLSPSNGNNEVIPECDEDDLLLNVTPMEPMTYEYIKSPPSGHQTPGFLSPKSSTGVGGIHHLGRMGML